MFLLTKKSTERFTDLNANVTPPTLNTWIKFNFFVTKTFLIFVSSVCRCRDEQAVIFFFISVYLYFAGPGTNFPEIFFSVCLFSCCRFYERVTLVRNFSLRESWTQTKKFVLRRAWQFLWCHKQSCRFYYLEKQSPYEKIFELREIDGSSMVAQIASSKHSGKGWNLFGWTDNFFGSFRTKMKSLSEMYLFNRRFLILLRNEPKKRFVQTNRFHLFPKCFEKASCSTIDGPSYYKVKIFSVNICRKEFPFLKNKIYSTVL